MKVKKQEKILNRDVLESIQESKVNQKEILNNNDIGSIDKS